MANGGGGQTATIETRIPARMDRLPWTRFHWMVIIGLGTVWILDGLEVTMVGSIASRLTEKGSGIELSASQIGTAAAFYVAGACLGALFFGQLTDRFGRKKLFILTLGVYILATGATAFAMSPLYFFIARFFTGSGIGGEYAAINSAIDELIPARVRGRVDLIINGSYWLGSAGGSALALIFLNTSIFAQDLGWRLAFGIGVILGFTILLVRRNVPESPRWLFIHGREEEAEQIVDEIERGAREETGEDLPEPDEAMRVRQREAIPFREIAGVAFKRYPKRAILGLALFVGQAFIYNGVTFDLGTIFSKFFSVSSGSAPVFLVVFAVGNFLGPLLLGRLFDTVGRKPMITLCYFASAAAGVILALLFSGGSLGKWGFEAVLVVTFFFASAGASAAYLTVSEIFPMETRALAIAFFYAVGTAIGGITGPLLFGHLIDSGHKSQVALAFIIGSVVMAIGGIAELLFGVKAEQAKLEDIAEPLTAAEAEREEHGPTEERTRAGAPRVHPDEEADDRDALEAARAAQDRAEAQEERLEQLEAQPTPQDPAERDSRDRELAAVERAAAAEHREAAEKLEAAGASRHEQLREQRDAEAALRSAREREQRIRDRALRRAERERHGMRRYRPGPGTFSGAPGMPLQRPGDASRALDDEIEVIARVLGEAGELPRRELARRVNARRWGPGRFGEALREAIDEGRARRLPGGRVGPGGDQGRG